MNSYLHPESGSSESFKISFKGVKKNPRRAKTGSMTQVPKIKLSKPQITEIINESPYAQIQSVTKNRSLSNIKLKLSTKNQTSYLNTSNSTSLLTKNKPNSTIHSLNNSESSSQLKYRLLMNGPQLSTSTSKSTAKCIEERLTENLNKIKDKHMSNAKFEAFRIAFTEIIEKDDNFGGLLKKIKDMYEQRLKLDLMDSSKELVDRLKDEINMMKEKITKSKEDNKFMLKKVEKFAKENTELSRQLDDRESRYIDLQDKLLKLSKIDLEDMPKDENA